MLLAPSAFASRPIAMLFSAEAEASHPKAVLLTPVALDCRPNARELVLVASASFPKAVEAYP